MATQAEVGIVRSADGLAADADLLAAAEAAARQALTGLGGAGPDLGLVWVCGDDPDLVAAAGERASALLGAPAVVGCSASGVIGAGRGLEATRAVSVWAAELPGVRLRTFHLEVMRADDGLAVVGMPQDAEQDRVAVLLADPWSFPVDGFVDQSNVALPGLPLVGGMALGAQGAGSTRLFIDGRSVDRGAVGVLLGGDVALRPVVSQGCRPVGPDMIVTRAEGNRILELAGVPALDKLEAIVGALPPEEQALLTTGLQLGVAMDEYAEVHELGDFLIRGVVGADRDTRALVVGDVVEVGRTVRFQVRDADAAHDDLTRILHETRTRLGHSDGALLFSCNGRGAHLFASADHDPLAVREHLTESGVGGFFAAGEIGPVGGRNYVHALTASMLVFGSGAGA